MEAEQAAPSRNSAEEAKKEGEREKAAGGREMRGWECRAGRRVWVLFCLRWEELGDIYRL